MLVGITFYSFISPPTHILSNLPGDEICGNNIDDDGDGFTDANDPDCIAAGSCGCPPDGISYSTISSGHTVPAGASHCITSTVFLNQAFNNIILNGNLYIVDSAQLYIDGNISMGPNGNLIVCDNASYIQDQTSNTYHDIYNFGWLQLGGTAMDVDDIIMGPNSLTALKGNSIDINGSVAFVGNSSEHSYLFLDISTNLNGTSNGNVCIQGGTPEIVVEVDKANVTPTCVTDCNGCPEMSNITQTFNDGSVETAYNMIIANAGPTEEICDNLVDDNGDGRVDEPYPGGVEASIQLWLKSDQGTNTSLPSNSITSWADQSANGYIASADVNSTDFPVYDDNAINFNPGVVFDGTYTDDFSDGLHLGSDYIYSTNDGMHFFIVLKSVSTGGQYDNVINFGNSPSNDIGFTWSSSATRYNTPTGFGGNSAFHAHNTGFVPALVGFEVDFGTTQSIYKNGGVISSQSTAVSQITANEINESDHYGTAANSDHLRGPVSIGRKSSSQYLDQNRIFGGAIAEVLVYNDSLSQIDAEKIDSYLGVKYGLTLTHHYYGIDNTIIKNIGDGYPNNIFGIGRSDCSGLYQKQSKSVLETGIVTLSLGTIANNNQANAGMISQNESYFLIGNNGQTTDSWTVIGGFAGDHRKTDRVWKINKTNFNEQVTFTIDVDDPNLDIADIPSGSSYKIMFDNDGDFANGGSLITTLNNVSGSLYELSNYNPGGFRYFTVVYEDTCSAQAPSLTK